MPIIIDPHTMPTGDVAKVLEVSVSRVQQLDDELAPVRGQGNRRRYNPAVVAAYAAKRGR